MKPSTGLKKLYKGFNMQFGNECSLLEKFRKEEKPELPKILSNLNCLNLVEEVKSLSKKEIVEAFPLLSNFKKISFVLGKSRNFKPKKIAVLFSGGQAAGGHNVVIGLFHALKNMHRESLLLGFLKGPDGLLNNQSIELNEHLLNQYLNSGGFDLLGSSRTKIESKEQFRQALNTVKTLDLDGLVIIGGDDSNTNAAFLAEYFLQEKIKTQVIGVPKTIDGDLKNKEIEISFGFDTACKSYAESIGSLARDALSAKKYYYFIKLMGRSASHVALECALEVKPNMTIISEEVQKTGKGLEDIVQEISEMIIERANQGKDYGVILIPEGILEFIPELKALILELAEILEGKRLEASEMESMESFSDKRVFVQTLLSKKSKDCFLSLPEKIQGELLHVRDPHGNIQVSKIQSEELFIALVERDLQRKKQEGLYKGKFNPQPIFLGYEGRSCFPSIFDSRYCYALGTLSAVLLQNGLTGYMALIQNLKENVDDWTIKALPLLSLMDLEMRKGVMKPVVKKALVDLEGAPFQAFKDIRESFILSDEYCYPGPIQFFGPTEITDKITRTLYLERKD